MNVKTYDLIYADPPWQYSVWGKNKGKGTAEKHYRTQSLNELKRMDIPVLCNPNCLLFMWATFPCLGEALELGRAWGFVYKTVAFVWIKTNKGNGKPFTGMGHYTRANAEIVLLFTKGKPLERRAKDIRQVLIAPRGRHSEKPDEIRKRIVRLYGEVARLELFAREDEIPGDQENHFEGWDVFGDQVSDSIIIDWLNEEYSAGAGSVGEREKPDKNAKK